MVTKEDNDEDDNDDELHSSHTTVSEAKIEIKVRRSDGSQDLVIRVSPAETIGNIKEMIFLQKNSNQSSTIHIISIRSCPCSFHFQLYYLFLLLSLTP